MYATTLEKIPAFVSTASVALEHLEVAVYRADDFYQAEIAPRILHAAIMTLHYFIQASIRTFVVGKIVGAWFWATVDRYATPDDALFFHATPDYLEPLPALPGFAPVALLPAAADSAPQRVLIPPVAQEPLELRAIASVERLNMGIRELRALAKDRGVKGYGKMSKTVLSTK
ncbi:MAG: hypothetical protein HC781_18325 [Leptolyngbyaceae cyanobacterium CSU_1_4]|nr:hypothetical protein [Leptolyngbyaceae cyanobacterium CSU_1_4]